jgi:hypothetical protein
VRQVPHLRRPPLLARSLNNLPLRFLRDELLQILLEVQAPQMDADLLHRDGDLNLLPAVHIAPLTAPLLANGQKDRQILLENQQRQFGAQEFEVESD